MTTCNGFTGATRTDFWGQAMDPLSCWYGRGALQLSWPGNYHSLRDVLVSLPTEHGTFCCGHEGCSTLLLCCSLAGSSSALCCSLSASSDATAFSRPRLPPQLPASGIDLCETPDAICEEGEFAFMTAIAYWKSQEAPWKQSKYAPFTRARAM